MFGAGAGGVICFYIPALGQFVFYHEASKCGFTLGSKAAIPDFLAIASCMYVGYNLGSRAEDYIREELRKRTKQWQYAYVDIINSPIDENNFARLWN